MNICARIVVTDIPLILEIERHVSEIITKIKELASSQCRAVHRWYGVHALLRFTKQCARDNFG